MSVRQSWCCVVFGVCVCVCSICLGSVGDHTNELCLSSANLHYPSAHATAGSLRRPASVKAPPFPFSLSLFSLSLSFSLKRCLNRQQPCSVAPLDPLSLRAALMRRFHVELKSFHVASHPTHNKNAEGRRIPRT